MLKAAAVIRGVMKKSELTIFAIDSAGKELEITSDSKKLAIHLIDYVYRLSEKILNQIDISGINVKMQ